MVSNAAKKHHGAEKVSHGKLPEASADMNVTPLIDVLLVLLIIFMAALPLTQKGHDINLPLEVSKSEYTADRRLTINKTEVTFANAEGYLRDAFASRREKTLFLIGDGSVRYEEIMRIIDAAVGAGVTKVGIVTMGMRQEAAGGGR